MSVCMCVLHYVSLCACVCVLCAFVLCTCMIECAGVGMVKISAENLYRFAKKTSICEQRETSPHVLIGQSLATKLITKKALLFSRVNIPPVPSFDMRILIKGSACPLLSLHLNRHLLPSLAMLASCTHACGPPSNALSDLTTANKQGKHG